MTAPSVAVLGPGGVGGYVAAMLARAGVPVTVIAREETAAAIARRGIRVRSAIAGEFTATPQAATALTEPPDLLVVATKATSLPGALDRIEAPPRLTVPLLNGLDHMALLHSRLAGPVLGSVIRIESHRPEPGVIVQSGPTARIDLASDDPALAAAVADAAALFERAGIETAVREREADVLWGKLVRLNALACTTAAFDLSLGEIRGRPDLRADLEACVRETAAAAQAEGADADADAAIAELERAHASLGSSMQRDLAAGREPELDAIPGAVLRAAARHGLEAPTVRRLAAIVADRAGVAAPG